MSPVAEDDALAALEGFLRTRLDPVITGCKGPDFVLSFVPAMEEQAGPLFAIVVKGGTAVVEREFRGDADHTVRYRVREVLDLIGEKRELLGPFWADHLPLDRADWGPALYAFFYRNHPYRTLSPVLQEIYLDPRYWPTITPPTQGYKLYRLTTEHDLQRTLEVGLAYGGSTLFFLAAHARRGRGEHIALDPFQYEDYAGEGLNLIERSGLGERFRFEPVRSREGLRDLARGGEVVDLAYVDGDHMVWAVLSDLIGVDALLRPGGFLAFDDSHMASGKAALRVIAENFDYSVLPGWSTDRLTVLQKRSERRPPATLRARVTVARTRTKVMLERRRIVESLRSSLRRR